MSISTDPSTSSNKPEAPIVAKCVQSSARRRPGASVMRKAFANADGSKLRVVRAGARVFHYGWVRTPEAMREKTFFMDQLYHGDPSTQAEATRTPFTGDNYRYKRFWGLRKFRGTHPAVMRERIAKKGWHWDLARVPVHLGVERREESRSRSHRARHGRSVSSSTAAIFWSRIPKPPKGCDEVRTRRHDL